MINYLSTFSPTLSELAELIRELSKEKVPFSWGPEHQTAFTEMKKEISSNPELAYYNTKKQTVLQTDASIKYLGACLLQEEKPVYFASKALTEAQKGYVAIKIESLAGALAMEKFHHFFNASHFIFKTDQKQRSSKRDSTLLDLHGRADNGIWHYLERHSYCYSPEEM